MAISTIENFTLKPGNNSLPLTAVVNQTAIISSLDTSGKVQVSITGQSAVYNGEHLTYYVSTVIMCGECKLIGLKERALASNVLSLELNVQQILADSAAAAVAAKST